MVAVIAGMAAHGAVSYVNAGASVAGTLNFLALSLTMGRGLVARLIRWSNDHMTTELPVITVILLVMLIMALTTKLIGVHTALGASGDRAQPKGPSCRAGCTAEDIGTHRRTPAAGLAIEMALALASASNGALTVLHVFDPQDDTSLLRGRARRQGLSLLDEARRLGEHNDMPLKAITSRMLAQRLSSAQRGLGGMISWWLVRHCGKGRRNSLDHAAPPCFVTSTLRPCWSPCEEL
jgi:nucleotide-binding universal stress UspA family protein